MLYIFLGCTSIVNSKAFRILRKFYAVKPAYLISEIQTNLTAMCFSVNNEYSANEVKSTCGSHKEAESIGYSSVVNPDTDSVGSEFFIRVWSRK